MAIIYLVTNMVNGKAYIGKTVSQLRMRWNQHKSEARKRKVNSALYKAIRKYGEQSFTVQELDNCPESDVNKRECAYIETRNPELGYNLTAGGEGVAGYRFTDEQRAKMSASRKGQFVSEEGRRLRSIWGKGRKCSEESRARYRAAALRRTTQPRTGMKHTEETKERMRATWASKRPQNV